MESARVRTGQSVLAVAAVVALIPALAVGLPSMIAGLFVLTAIPVAVPLLLRRDPQAFARACVIIGTGLLTWGAVGIILGMFLFIPSAVMLLVAAFVDRRTRPGVLWGPCLLAVPVVAGVCMAGSTSDEPTTYSCKARLAPGDRLSNRDSVDQKDRLTEFGATRTSVYESGKYSSYLDVEFPAGLPEARIAKLKEQVELLPGVLAVDGC